MVESPPGADTPLVSVVVPNWNGCELLRECLDSVHAQTYAPIEPILVDDGSTDESAGLVASEYPKVRLVRLAKNRGFASAANAGMRAATGDILALLNNDAIAEPDWVTELVAALRRHPEAGSAASKILLQGSSGQIHSAGDVFRRDGTPDSRGVWEIDDGQYDDEAPVFGGCGGAVAYRRELIESVGGFDERFFMYCEDVDLAFRAQMSGFTCIYAPRAVVRHRLGASAAGAMSAYLCGRNFVWLLARDVSGASWRRQWPAFAVAQLRIAADALRHARQPSARARLRGQIAGLMSAFGLIQDRRALGSRRRVPESYLDDLLT